MDPETPEGEVVCPGCGTILDRAAKACPVCERPSSPWSAAEGASAPRLTNATPAKGADLWYLADDEIAGGVGQAVPTSRTMFYGTSLALAVALLAVIAGVWMEYPGLAGLLAVIAGPPFLATFVTAASRRSQDVPMGKGAVSKRAPAGPMTRTEMAETFTKTLAITTLSVISMMAVSALLTILFAVAVVVALFVICASHS